MKLLRLDLERQYARRAELFARRWQYGRDRYRELSRELNAAIRGYETVLCTHFPVSLSQIFAQSEAGAD